MVKDASEARFLTKEALDKLVAEADVSRFLTKITTDCESGLHYTHVYKFITLGEMMALTRLGFTVESQANEGYQYMISWWQPSLQPVEVLLNG